MILDGENALENTGATLARAGVSGRGLAPGPPDGPARLDRLRRPPGGLACPRPSGAGRVPGPTCSTSTPWPRVVPVALMDNAAAVDAYADVLVPLADEFGVAIRFWHHESQEGAARKSGSRKSAAMGARQSIDQADAHLSFVKTRTTPRSPMATACGPTRRPRCGSKFRGGREGQVERIEWTGHRNAAGDLERLEASTGDDADEAIIAGMVRACDDAPLGSGALAREPSAEPQRCPVPTPPPGGRVPGGSCRSTASGTSRSARHLPRRQRARNRSGMRDPGVSRCRACPTTTTYVPAVVIASTSSIVGGSAEPSPHGHALVLHGQERRQLTSGTVDQTVSLLRVIEL